MRKLITLLNILIIIPALSLSALGSEDDAWIGIYTQTVDEDLMEAFDLDSEDGVIIKTVVPGSPGDKAGLNQGDIILSIDGKEILSSDQLSKLIKKYEPGDEIKIQLIHDSDNESILVELGERDDYDEDRDNHYKALKQYNMAKPKSLAKTFTWFDEDQKYSNTYIGVGLNSLNTQLGEYFGVEKGHGALIEEVVEDSPAEKAGLKAGDVIVKIDGSDVESPSDISSAVKEKEEGDEIDIVVLRNKNEMEFSVLVEDAPDDYHQYFFQGNVPGLDESIFFNLPKMKGLHKGDFDFNFKDLDGFDEDMDDLDEEMDDLREELKELRKELKDIKKKLE